MNYRTIILYKTKNDIRVEVLDGLTSYKTRPPSEPFIVDNTIYIISPENKVQESTETIINWTIKHLKSERDTILLEIETLNVLLNDAKEKPCNI